MALFLLTAGTICFTVGIYSIAAHLASTKKVQPNSLVQQSIIQADYLRSVPSLFLLLASAVMIGGGVYCYGSQKPRSETHSLTLDFTKQTEG